MRNISKSVFCSLLLAGCAESALTVTPSEDCSEIGNVEFLLDQEKPEIIVIGEEHGMNEPPEFIDALVCQSLKAGYRTALALEVPDTQGLYQGLYREYLASNGDEVALEELFKGYLWTSNRPDGRSSKAILALIEKLRLRFLKGEDVAFIPFSDALDATPFFDPETGALLDENSFFEANEKAMADEIKSQSQRLNADKTIVLVGRAHAKNGKITFGNLDYRTMGDFFDPSNTKRLKAISSGGTAWTCKQNAEKKLICGESRVEGQDLGGFGMGEMPPYRVLLKNDSSSKENGSDLETPDFYDGLVHVGPATVSSPANMAGRKSGN